MTTIETIKKIPWWGKVLSVIVILAGGTYIYKKTENKSYLDESALPLLKRKRIEARTKLDAYEDAMRTRGYKRENYIPRDDFQRVYKKWANLNDRIVDLENM